MLVRVFNSSSFEGIIILLPGVSLLLAGSKSGHDVLQNGAVPLASGLLEVGLKMNATPWHNKGAEKRKLFLCLRYTKDMTKASYIYFKQNYAVNKPLEDVTIQKALEHFNRKSPARPFRITETQNKANHKTMRYDALLSNGVESIRVEAKTDQTSNRTGNFFIEFEQYGKNSGITTTEADYYVITDAVKFYLISVDDIGEVLRQLDEEGDYRTGTHVNTDRMLTKGFLIKNSRLLEFAIDIT